jgi:archaellum component FlaF (FlaF/FlaG flagellin family)
MSKQTYLDNVANAFKEVRAWKSACLALGAVCCVLGFGLIYQERNAPMILVPYDFATASGNVKINPNGKAGEVSPDYLATLALADLATVLDWTPETVEVQNQRFLNRLSTSLYADQNIDLTAKAAEFKANSTTESFYPNGTRVDASQNQVIVDGTLVRWEGEKQTLNKKVIYKISYQTTKGYLHVSALKIEDGKE